ncbi:hypothetical protein WJX74_009457 [Apatococcus lobatus]|uniref:phosphatidylinositol 3-kinase n=1 Tax=Apatococcus lobatus TaxID=904363 RepID=A0AAW1S2T4_9CHLO
MTGGGCSFTFFLSRDINLPVRLRVDRLVVKKHCGRDKNDLEADQGATPAIYVEAQLSANGEALGQPLRTRYSEAGPLADSIWSGWNPFTSKYRDLPRTTQVAVTAWELKEGHARAVPLGGATFCLFSKRGRLKTGRQKLCLWPGVVADPRWPSTTPGKPPLSRRGELGRLEQLQKQFKRGEVEQVSWLDGLTWKEIEKLRVQEEKEARQGERPLLFITLPSFPHAVLYQEAVSGPAPGLSDLKAHHASGESPIVLIDPEVGRENPVELKAQKLARGLARGLVDRDLRPDTSERRRINHILSYPPNRPLGAEERVLMWRFRFSLTSDRRALTKFLKCVDWSDASEARQAAELMQQWAPIEIADALELLSPDFSNQEVRAHAVEVLKRADDEELRYYLLPLVQALRYEPSDDSRLARFLVSRATADIALGIPLHWYLYTEWEDPGFGPRAATVHTRFTQTASEPLKEAISNQMQLVAQLKHINTEIKAMKGAVTKKTEKLRQQLGEHGACSDLLRLRLPLPLDPSAMLDGILPEHSLVFKSAMSPLLLTFALAGKAAGEGSGPPGEASAASGSSHRRSMEDGGRSGSPTHPPSTSSEAGGRETRRGLSSKPSTEAERYMLIYKRGDDLRQDQLVVQILSLMDRLLKRENLDLKLTPYKVLPTSPEDGVMECVPHAAALAKIFETPGGIPRYLQQFHAQPHAPFGIKPEVHQTYLKSCAGYCVMTYILGVGDRHLDNLMLTTDGRLFHIDFGYILGRDPKPFPPPMKLCREMVEAMGGADSEHYRHFKMLCCEAYNILRKSASLILSLFHLMSGAAIPDIHPDPEKAMLKLQEKLRLDLDDESAIEWMQQLLNESATALMPQIMETGHRWAQYWR